MPQKPVAYAAEYEFADENVVAMRRRLHMDAMHLEHMRTMQPPIKKDIVHTIIKSPNKKKQQLLEDRQLSIATENEHLVERMQRIVTRRNKLSIPPISKPSNQRLRQKMHSKIRQENRVMKDHLQSVKGTYSTAQWKRDAETAARLAQRISKAPKRSKLRLIAADEPRHSPNNPAPPEFEFLVLNDIDEEMPMRTAKEIKAQIQSKLPLIHNKAAAYLTKELTHPDPFQVTRRPFE
ncbi:hypothetical protein, variant [Aphanomyces invadans]|uniref:Uncharacterized protein n=1 Tax=Aphanomyces invadans TaxID=157072 RepID=A0A024UG08_9STRA|nr:hypothetical protein, variant [Aphanomyces invadans]XP_008866002.1 hypothetical protein H310_03786 [Aphanomyces invadans]ETW04563.1 hypothetical protein H310_03786 [Aphanomyces invadans]ETW04564.1 hypothetical protein, variant [Aphanomyces invadans]RHY34558.1 hypothetical protein DYB32_000861 [Aphanomyces invadans]|eukprot:XP_008866001.1 hypothetical protein, variant [Aphanomyces invadans]